MPRKRKRKMKHVFDPTVPSIAMDLYERWTGPRSPNGERCEDALARFEGYARLFAEEKGLVDADWGAFTEMERDALLKEAALRFGLPLNYPCPY